MKEDEIGKRFQQGHDGTSYIVRAKTIKELVNQDRAGLYDMLELDKKDNYAILAVKQFNSIEIAKNLKEEDIPKLQAEKGVEVYGYKINGKETILKDIN